MLLPFLKADKEQNSTRLFSKTHSYIVVDGVVTHILDMSALPPADPVEDAFVRFCISDKLPCFHCWNASTIEECNTVMNLERVHGKRLSRHIWISMGNKNDRAKSHFETAAWTVKATVLNRCAAWWHHARLLSVADRLESTMDGFHKRSLLLRLTRLKALSNEKRQFEKKTNVVKIDTLL